MTACWHPVPAMQTINIRLGYWALHYVKKHFVSQYLEFLIDWRQLPYEIVFIWRERILQVWFNTTPLFSVDVRSDPNYLYAMCGTVSLTVMVLEEGRCIIPVKMMNQWESCQQPMYVKILSFKGEEAHLLSEQSHRNVQGVEFGTSWSPAGRRFQVIKM